MTSTVLDIHDLHVSLPQNADRPYAVEGLNISIERDQIVCVVGESGSGKTLTGRAVMRLLPGPYVKAVGGRIDFGGEDLLKVSEARMRQIRGDRIAMIFQEPMTALNPLMTIGEQIDELVRMHTRLPKPERRARARAILDDVGLPDPAGMLGAYPHELSGGQRQRAMCQRRNKIRPLGGAKTGHFGFGRNARHEAAASQPRFPNSWRLTCRFGPSGPNLDRLDQALLLDLRARL